MARNDVDDLFELKASFYTGNFQACIDEAQKLRLSGEKLVERDCFVYRSYIAQSKFRVVIDAIRPNAEPALRAVRMFAEFMASAETKRKQILETLEEQLQADASNDVFMLMTASAFYVSGNYESALRCIHQSNDLECMSFAVKILLTMNRGDLASKEQKKMCDIDEDSILTQLATAWLNVTKGGPATQNAYNIYHDLQDRFQSTPLLLNSMAVCCLNQEKLEEALDFIKEAYDKDTNNVDTLVNYVTALKYSGKTDLAKRYISQLYDSHPEHPIVKDWVSKENDFDRISSQFLANRES
jgi:coatomer protein complex subunit epsilon